MSHTNTTFKMIVHLGLVNEIPFMTLIPHSHYQFTAIQKTFFEKIRSRVSLMPYHELESIE